MIPRRSRRLAFAVLVVILLGVALLALVWLRRPSLPAGALYDEPPIEAELPGRLLPVEGNPGWESLPAEERERAFHRFWSHRSAGRLGGSGLGLAIVRKLVEADGGTVELRARPGGGLDAVVVLPPASPPEGG